MESKFKFRCENCEKEFEGFLSDKIICCDIPQIYILDIKGNDGKLRNFPLGKFLSYQRTGIFKNGVMNLYNVPEEKINKEEEISWENLYDVVKKFRIYEGSERIYNICIDDEIIKLEGKEIMDYNIFILKLFEKKGIMLPTFRGIRSHWAKLVTHWRKKYGEIAEDKREDLSETEEAKETIIDYIENSSIVDNYVIKEGVICLKENLIYVPTRIIKRILKRNALNISMRKLAYILDDYLASGSIPIKISNHSERFWKFKINKFDIEIKKKIEVEDE